MMSRVGTVARVAARTARPAQRRVMSTSKDHLIRDDGWKVKFTPGKKLEVPVYHAVWDPTTKSNAYIPIFSGIVAFGVFITYLPWAVQGKKWAAAQGE